MQSRAVVKANDVVSQNYHYFLSRQLAHSGDRIQFWPLVTSQWEMSASGPEAAVDDITEIQGIGFGGSKQTFDQAT